MNSPYHERLQAIREENERIKEERRGPPGPPTAPPPPMDWSRPSENPRMVKLRPRRQFEPGRVQGTRKKSEMEQVSIGEGSILVYSQDSSNRSVVSDKSETTILLKSSFCWISYNRHVTSYLQGSKQPMCGLAACIMAGEAMDIPDYSDFELDDFLEAAVDNGFTKQGEMFQAEDLASLADQILDCESTVLYGGIDENYQSIIMHLMEGHPWIVPHDADHDHRPTTKNGEKSHWGIVTGFIVGLETDANQRGLHKSGSTAVRNYFLVDDFKKTPRDLRRQILSLDPSTAPIFLLAKQGRAPGLKVWEWSALAKSNSQLFEFDTSRFPGDYMLPPGGVRVGLNEKSVLLKPKTH